MEDALTYALFPHIAPSFFENRNNPSLIAEKDKIEDKDGKEKKEKNQDEVKGYIVNFEGHEFKILVKEVEPEKLNLSSIGMVIKNVINQSNNEKITVNKIEVSENQSEETQIKTKSKDNKENEMIKPKEKIVSPVTGTVLKILKSNGDEIKAGDVILTLEAMKVEFEIKSPSDGNVKILVEKGDVVQSEDLLCEIY
ncbi:MAG: biotin/lipoyl-containing protein [Exilispira sp.]